MKHIDIIRKTLSLFTAASMTAGAFTLPAAAYSEQGYTADEALSAPALHEGISGKPVGGLAKPEGHKAPEKLVNSARPAAASRDDAVSAEYTYSGSYAYEMLTDREKQFYLDLKVSFDEFAESRKDAVDYVNYDGFRSYYISPVSYEGMTLDEAVDVLFIFIYSQPQYYFVDLDYLYSTLEDGDDELFWPCILSGMAKASKREKVEAAINKTLDEWMPEIEAQVTVTAKELKIAELICGSITYDDEALETAGTSKEDGYDQTLIGAFYEHSCVCAGYAQAASFLCNAAGIESFCVTSETHQWNVVKLYDNWYQLDTTWMDTDAPELDYDWCNVSYDRLQQQDPDGAHAYEQLWSSYKPPKTVYDNVKIPDLGLVGIRITTPPLKTVYALGDKLDMTGGVLTAYYAESAKGEYTEEIPLTSEKISVNGNTDTAGKCNVTLGYGGKTVTLPVTVYDPLSDNVNVVCGDEFQSFDTLGKAFAYINGKKDNNADYIVTINRKVFEDKIKFPTAAKSIVIAANGDAVISTNTSAISLACDAEIACPIVKKDAKAINYTTAKNKTLTITADIDAGTIKGGAGSTLLVRGDVEASGLSAFSKVEISGSLSLSGKTSGIGALSGELVLKAGSSAVIDSIGDALIMLSASEQNGIVTLPKLTVTCITAPVSIATDADSLPSSGTAIMSVANINKFDGLDNLTVIDTDAKGNSLAPFIYGKEIRAEYADAMTVTVKTSAGTTDVAAPSFEKVSETLEAYGDGAECTVEIHADVVCGKFKLPAKLAGLTIRGGTLTMPGGSISVKYPLTFSDITINAVDKKGSPAVLNIRTTGTLTLKNTVINAKDVTLRGNRIVI